MIEQKGMTFDHDFGYSFILFSSLLKKEERRKGEWTAKLVIKSHAFLLDQIISVWIFLFLLLKSLIRKNESYQIPVWVCLSLKDLKYNKKHVHKNDFSF